MYTERIPKYMDHNFSFLVALDGTHPLFSIQLIAKLTSSITNMPMKKNYK